MMVVCIYDQQQQVQKNHSQQIHAYKSFSSYQRGSQSFVTSQIATAMNMVVYIAVAVAFDSQQNCVRPYTAGMHENIAVRTNAATPVGMKYSIVCTCNFEKKPKPKGDFFTAIQRLENILSSGSSSQHIANQKAVRLVLPSVLTSQNGVHAIQYCLKFFNSIYLESEHFVFLDAPIMRLLPISYVSKQRLKKQSYFEFYLTNLPGFKSF